MDAIKVAVCVSGMCEGNAAENMDRLRSQFPYGFYFGTWKGKENTVSRQLNALSFDEPVVKYHPYCDVGGCLTPKFQEKRVKLAKLGNHSEAYKKTIHQNKQILAHAYMLDSIPQEYNMIIRTRYDIIISNKLSYEQYIKQSYNENCAIGFGALYSIHPTMHEIHPARLRSWQGFLQDTFIIHPRVLFDTNRAFKLYEEKKLRAAEFGWYQMLGEPYNDNHRCFYGGSQIERNINRSDKQIQNEMK